MTISQAQYVDLLVKKLYGVSTTDTATNKSPSNESIPSPELNRGDTLWTQANQIPTVAANVANISLQYGNSNPIQCVPDTTSVPILNSQGQLIYPTWLTTIPEWIPPEFGSDYTVNAYVGPANIGNLTGANVTFISGDGEGGSNPGEFFFDYQAGLLYFIGQTIPNVLTTGNVVYITGYKYNGLTGVTNLPSNTKIGSINIVDSTISSIDVNGNLVTIGGTSGVVIPSGNTAQRPSNAVLGTTRFNTVTDSIETWDGSAWVNSGNSITPGTITDQQITPDGVSDTYTLTQSTTSASIIVSINGVTQAPEVSYTVTGNSITFTQTPLTQDLIDIRFIAYTTTVSAITNSTGNSSVSVGADGNILFTTANSTFATMTANAVDINGALSTTGNITTSGYFIGTFAGNVVANIVAPGLNTQVIYNSNGNLAASAGFTFNANSNALTSTGNITGANILTAGAISAAGNVIANNISATNLSGNLTSGTQSNITGLGTLTSLNVNGNINGSNVIASTVNTTNINAVNVGNSSTSYIGANVSVTGTITASSIDGIINTANQPNITSVGTLTSLSVAGDTVSNYFVGDGSNLANINGANVTGTVQSANVADFAFSVNGSNVIGSVASANTANTANTVTVNAQPNITSVGILSGLAVSGGISVNGNINSNSNILSNGVISTAGNITGSYILGNGAYLTGIAPSYGNANVTNLLNTGLGGNVIPATGNTYSLGSPSAPWAELYVSGNSIYIDGSQLSSSGGNLYFQGNALITSNPSGNFAVSNTLSAGNVVTSGFINATGNITGANLNVTSISSAGNIFSNGFISTSNTVIDGNISTSGNVTAPYFIGNLIGNISGNLTVPGANTQVIYNNDGAANASPGLTFDYASNSLVSTGTITGSNFLTNGFVSATGNIIGSHYIGNGATLSNITGANVTGYVNNATNAISATTAATVTTNAQSNITSVGILTSLSVAGNASAGNVTTTGTVSAIGNIQTSGYFIGTFAGNISGNLTVPGSNTQVIYNNNGNAGASAGFTFNSASNAMVVTGAITGSNLLSSGNISAAGNIIGNGATLSNITGANVTGSVANATYATTAGTSATVTTNAQPNITSVGVLTSLSVSGNSTPGNLLTPGMVSAAGNIYTPGYFIGNFQGNISGNLTVPGSNTQVIYNNNGNAGASAGLTFDSSSNSLISTGTITGSNFLTGGYISAAGNIIGNGSQLTSITGANVTGVVANATYAVNAGTALTVTTNAQPNITSVGTLASLTVSANTNSGNLLTTGIVSATGNIETSGYFLGTFAGNISGNLTVPGANTQVIYNNNGNAGASTGFTFNAASNAMVVSGNVNGGNILTSGLISSTGNAVHGNVNATSYTGNTVSVAGNISASQFIGSGNTLSNITGANVTGVVPSATLAATVTTNAQPNITSVGVLTSLSVSGNSVPGNLLTAGQVSATGNIVTAGYFIGNFQGNVVGNLTVPGSNTQVIYNNQGNAGAAAGFTFNSASNAMVVTGNVTGGNILTAGSLSVGGTITSANTVVGANVSTVGNVTGNYIIGNGSTLSAITAGNIVGTVANATFAINASTITTNAQPNITSVGVLTSLSVSGNSVPGNLLTAGQVSAAGNITTNGYFLGTFAGNISGNLTVPGSNTQVIYNNNGNAGASTGFTFNSASNAMVVSGNISSGNVSVTGTVYTPGTTINNSISTSGNVTGNYITGNGSQLTSITGANVIGTVSNATTATVAGNVTNNVQSNITAVGILSSLSVSGNVTANYYNGNGSLLTGVVATGIGTLGNLSVTGNTQTGNLLTGGFISATGNATFGNSNATSHTGTTVSVTGNITGANFIGNGSLLSSITAANIVGNVANATYATNAGGANIAIIAGTVTTNAQPNITSVGTLSSLSVSGNITGSYILGNGSQLTGVTATSVGILPTLSVSGNINNSGNIIQTGTGNINGYNGYFSNNLTVIGTFQSTSNITANGAGIFYGNAITGDNALYAGVPGFTPLGSNVVLQVAGNVNSYSQINFQNINTGANASTDFILTASNGNDTAYFADFGIGSNNYSYGGFFSDTSVKNDVYLYAVGTNAAGPSTTSGPGNLILGSTNGQIKLFVGNTAQANVIQQISSIGIAVTGLVSATGNITGSYHIGNGATLSSITGANVTGTVSSATTASTVTGNAQGNITSVGTLTSLNVSGTVSAATLSASGSVYGTVFSGKATTAQYADVAELYLADADYTPGTVVSFGGELEVTASSVDGDRRIAGIVSTNPAYLMNSELEGDNVVAVALTGRVPTRVTGIVRKGDMLVSNGDGTARAESNPQLGAVLGKSLEDFSGETGVIETVVGRL